MPTPSPIPCAVLAALASLAANAADVSPAAPEAHRGRLLLSENLDHAPADLNEDAPLTRMKRGWKMWSGKWEFAGGAMKGTQLPADGRGAVAACVLPLVNVIVQFELRFIDCRQVHFRFQDSVPEHIARVIIGRDGFSAQKDDHDHQGPDQPLPFGKIPLAGSAESWRTVTVEVLGQHFRATIDGKTVSGSHPLIATTKHFFDFVVSGGSAEFRNLRVWEALADPRKP